MNKKCILSLRLPSKCSFTFSKLRFFRLRKPKTTSFYSLSSVLGLTISLFSQPFLYSEPGSKCKALARTHISADYSRAIDIILFAQNKKRETTKVSPSTRNRGRTGTGISAHRILSPACLPIPPSEQSLKTVQMYNFYFILQKFFDIIYVLQRITN